MHMQMQAHQMQLSGGPERSGRRGSCSWPGPGHRRRIGSDRITKVPSDETDQCVGGRSLYQTKFA
jgi:hypothetical protein